MTWLPLHGLAQLALIAYLAGFLFWSGPLTGGLWIRGEHPTPELWTYHLLLEGLGIAHHHGAGPGPAPAEVAAEIERSHLLAAAVAGPQLVAGPALPGFSADHTLHQLAGGAAVLVLLLSTRRVLASAVIARGLAARAPEQPPPTDR